MSDESDPWTKAGKTEPPGRSRRDIGADLTPGARARFDNASHPGRNSPVRKALRLGGKRGAGRRRVTAEEVALHRGLRAREAFGGTSGDAARSEAGHLDPWAEEEPVFGQREMAHALSPTPGTPPHGYLAVEPPRQCKMPLGRAASQGVRRLWDGLVSIAGKTRQAAAGLGQSSRPDRAASSCQRRGPDRAASSCQRRGPDRAAAVTDGLCVLREPVRVELELEHCGRWTCGLVERASSRGLEVALGVRGVGTRDFLAAGRRVRLLVSAQETRAASVATTTAARAGRPFQLHTKILWVDPPSGPGGAVRAQLVIDTTDAGAVARWQGLVERMRT